MADKDWKLRMFPDLRNKSNDLSVVAGLSMVTSTCYSKFERCKIDLFLPEWLLDTISQIYSDVK